MLLERKIILGTKEKPLIVLEKRACNIHSFPAAQKELVQSATKNKSLVWGYYSSLDKETTYPACAQLAQDLRKITGTSLQLAFIRVSTGKQESGIGGLHTDSHIDGRPIVDPTRKENEEVLRVLLNGGTMPRKLGYCEFTPNELAQKGAILTEMGYTKVELPSSISMKTIEIPPREENAIWALTFWASLIPHTGIDDERGHFLIAYGKYAIP